MEYTDLKMHGMDILNNFSTSASCWFCCLITLVYAVANVLSYHTHIIQRRVTNQIMERL